MTLQGIAESQATVSIARTNDAFAPFGELAQSLFAAAGSVTDDGSHDISHLLRVWKNASAIHAVEGGDVEILFAATLLHDCVAVEKNSPLRGQASRLSADKAADILQILGWPQARIEGVAHAVHAHSFSAGVACHTVEARILQDADRLDAIGVVGVARCFYVAGRMGSKLYEPNDPFAEHRELDDGRFALDHFKAKLLKLSSGFQTEEGARLAQERHRRMENFLSDWAQEI